MKLRDDKELKKIIKEFAVLDKHGILSSESDTESDATTDDEDLKTTVTFLGVQAYASACSTEVKDRQEKSVTLALSGSKQLQEKFDFESEDELTEESGEARPSAQENKYTCTAKPTPSSAILTNPETESKVKHLSPPENETEFKDCAYYTSLCKEYMDFTDDNPTTYHAVSTFSKILENAGFTYLPEKAPFSISKEGGAYYTTRGGQSLAAFVVGKEWTPSRGLGAIGSHVDALTAKLKPNSTKRDVHGYNLLGVAAYSGALNSLWVDRDLGIAGSILVKNEDTGVIESRLVSSGRHPICRIPSLAPHFGSASLLPYNKETQMVPVVGYGVPEQPATAEEEKAPLFGKHSLALLRYVAKLANTSLALIMQVDLELFDVQAACRGGLHNEFMYAPRIDDRLCSFAAVHGIKNLAASVELDAHDGFSAILLANNEEIGSASRTGAKGKLLNSVVERVLCQRGYSAADASLVFANSIILSADVTHALNPNFVHAYLEGHFPLPNTGLTLKLDANGHVMTDLTGVVVMNSIAEKNKLKLQQFHIRNDKPSGGTIGPMLAVDTGARVVDVGLPQLSMHSIRASAGYKEAGLGVRTFAAFFRDWRGALDLIDYQ